MEEIKELHKRTHFQKIAIFAIVGFLILISAALVIVTHSLQNEQAITYQSKAYEASSSQMSDSQFDESQNQYSSSQSTAQQCKSTATFYRAIPDPGGLYVKRCQANVYCNNNEYRGTVECGYNGIGGCRLYSRFDDPILQCAQYCDKAECNAQAAVACGCSVGGGQPTPQAPTAIPISTSTPTTSECFASITYGSCSNNPFCECNPNVSFTCSNGKSASLGNANCALRRNVEKNICTACSCAEGCIR